MVTLMINDACFEYWAGSLACIELIEKSGWMRHADLNVESCVWDPYDNVQYSRLMNFYRNRQNRPPPRLQSKTGSWLLSLRTLYLPDQVPESSDF